MRLQIRRNVLRTYSTPIRQFNGQCRFLSLPLSLPTTHNLAPIVPRPKENVGARASDRVRFVILAMSVLVQKLIEMCHKCYDPNSFSECIQTHAPAFLSGWRSPSQEIKSKAGPLDRQRACAQPPKAQEEGRQVG